MKIILLASLAQESCRQMCFARKELAIVSDFKNPYK